MSGSCCARNDDVMIVACSGGSNVGQLANQAAVELTREGFGKMFCLAGIGGGLSGFVKSAQEAPRVVVLDGCPVGCAKAVMNAAKASMTGYVVVTDLGIEKVKDRELRVETAETEKVKRAARAAAQPVSPDARALTPCGCGRNA